MDQGKVNVGIVGCGNIAGPYAQDLATYDHLNLVGVADIDQAKAEALAAKYDRRCFGSVDDLLADPAIDVVVNLTVHHAHYDVTTRCLNAGKHVYSEKPLALTYAQAQQLVDLAHQKGLRLGCSPFTYLGEAQQTAWRTIREGKLGTVRVAYAEVNWGRIESWHPAPSPFYEVGPLFDVGVYPLTMLTAIFGPARNVWAYGRVLHPDRIGKTGVRFHIETPEFVVAMLELSNGTIVRLTTNFYVGQHNKQKGIEFHGDDASLYLSSWQEFDAKVEFAPFGTRYEPAPYVKEPPRGTPWGRGVAEMTQAMLADRPHRVTGEHAAHVVEILCATVEAMHTGRAVAIHSDFTPPQPMEWAE